MKRVKKIMLALETPYAAARQKMRGVFRYVAEGHDWDIRLIRSRKELSAETIRVAEKEGADGYIISIPDAADAIAELAKTDTPLVAVEIRSHRLAHRKNLVFMLTDNSGIGRFAAERLLELGYFRSFAVVSDFLNRYWSAARAAAFLETLAKRKRGCDTFIFDSTSPDRASELAGFLVALPKPAGVFAVWDFGAAEVISLCRARGLAVPSQVSVLGVDNDDFVCESTKPAISTILVDREKQGYDAAAALDALIRGKGKTRPPSPICRVSGLIQRESTAPLAPSGPLVERALKFIEEKAVSGIGPAAVAAHLKVSRRLLDLRFSELKAGTLAGAIRKRKLAEVEKMLESTALSDARIAEKCGFKNVNSLRNVFRDTHGITMRGYRTGNAR